MQKRHTSIIKGDNIRCNCGKHHRWGGFKKNKDTAGYDKAGWHLRYHQISTASVEYEAVCPECQAEEKESRNLYA